MSTLEPRPDISKARLRRQSYGIAGAQKSFGGPRGIWLECRAPDCAESQVIVGSRFEDDPYTKITDAEAAQVFRRHGWTGDGERMMSPRCPACSSTEGKSA